MRRVQLAHRLIAAKEVDRRLLLTEYRQLADVRLAEEIRAICHAAWTSEPITAQRAADVMKLLARIAPVRDVKAIEAWVCGISYITKGKFELAVSSLDKAARLLNEAGRHHDAAQTQMAKLLALGMLGRYDDAVAAGENARAVFLENGDELAAGKIEVNLANIVSRSGRHRQAEAYAAAARARFIDLGERELQAVAENGLANTYSELNEFDNADRYYRMALETAHGAGMQVTEAEIEASIGGLAQVRGRYADALRFLEQSRTKYEALGMPHQSAIADLEIADLYAELNLSTEALETYERVTDAFAKLGMRGEEARARLNYGRSAYVHGNLETAAKELEVALKLFTLERNDSGRASAMLARARIAIESGKTDAALDILSDAAPVIDSSENPRDRPAADWLEGEANLKAGRYAKADKTLSSALSGSERLGLPDLAQSAVNSLGKTARAAGDVKTAERHFKSAIRLIEKLRAPLGFEEFSMSFLASRLEPYDHLVKLYLETGRTAKAFRTLESGRSRSLLDAMDRSARDGDAAGVDGRTAEFDQVRAELNAYYKRLDRADADEIDRIRAAINEREKRLTQLTRRMAVVTGTVNGDDAKNGRPDLLKTLKTQLANDKALVEYVEFEGVISAFVVTGRNITFVPSLARAADVSSLLEGLHFQFGSMRYGMAALERFRDEMRARADHYLSGLYDLLVAPIERHLSAKSLVIVPAGVLHYVPFNALKNKDQYLLDRFEVTLAPSASVWSRLQERPKRRVQKPLLMAYADERIPLVEQEVAEIGNILPGSQALTGESASFSAFVDRAGSHDLIHLACHGQFRPENPMFSSLHLADGWVTVRDICSRSIPAALVTLSACETGLSKVFAGDEILGLARGFLTAGADALIVSLWTVNDCAAGELMSHLYSCLQRGTSLASSLKDAQLELVRRGEHPYFWSPFVLIGR